MWTAPHFGLDSGAPDVSALSTNRVLAVPKRLQRACNVPLPEHAEHLKIGGAGEIRTHGADNRTTDPIGVGLLRVLFDCASLNMKYTVCRNGCLPMFRFVCGTK
jgi:hypothetical protein